MEKKEVFEIEVPESVKNDNIPVTSKISVDLPEIDIEKEKEKSISKRNQKKKPKKEQKAPQKKEKPANTKHKVVINPPASKFYKSQNELESKFDNNDND